MSASLVGSGDVYKRQPRSSFLGLLGGHRTSSPRPLRGSPGRSASSLGAVSYTHLTLPTICSV
eukprot:11927654-Alexandrium_andersonii.AAC.1